ncbi:RDD family protein [Mycobacterium sp.]|uniref:RDD family protein n=1 Tax=Mycobacterium sp. TaxID=1785 RepID=UPI0025E3585A|nr:RDD family protein [Mycobacterium sp.]
MTVPPGNYPPPPSGYPPPPGNYPPPQSSYPPPAGYPSAPGGQPGALPAEAYTPWLTRVLAFLVDYVPYAVILGIGFGIEAATQETACITDTSELQIGTVCATGNSTLGVAAVVISALVALVFVFWNLGYKQGTTGSSIGKSVLKFKVVSEETGQPLGFGMSIVRQFAHAIDAVICYVGFLFPLWDAKRQTIADKLVKSVCLPIT